MKMKLVRNQPSLMHYWVKKKYDILMWSFAKNLQKSKNSCYPAFSPTASAITVVGLNHTVIACLWSNRPNGASVETSTFSVVGVCRTNGPCDESKKSSSLFFELFTSTHEWKLFLLKCLASSVRPANNIASQRFALRFGQFSGINGHPSQMSSWFAWNFPYLGGFLEKLHCATLTPIQECVR